MNLPEMLDSNARKNPRKDCLKFQGSVYSYLALQELAGKAAAQELQFKSKATL